MMRHAHEKARECLQVLTSTSAEPERKATACKYLLNYIQDAESQERQLKDAETRITRANRIIKPITGRGY